MTHDIISDILAADTVPRNRKRAVIYAVLAEFRDTTRNVMTREEWMMMGDHMGGIEAMGGPVLPNAGPPAAMGHEGMKMDRGDTSTQAFGDRVVVIELRLPAGDPEADGAPLREPGVPGEPLGPLLKFPEFRRMEPAESHAHSAGTGKVEIERVQGAHVDPRAETPGLDPFRGDAEYHHLLPDHRFQAGGAGDPDVVGGGHQLGALAGVWRSQVSIKMTTTMFPRTRPPRVQVGWRASSYTSMWR